MTAVQVDSDLCAVLSAAVLAGAAIPVGKLVHAVYGIGQTIIFSSCCLFFLLLFPRRISAVAEWMSAILAGAGLTCAACGSLKIQDAKKSPKIAIWPPSHNFVDTWLSCEGIARQSEKKLVKQQYVFHGSPQYGELRPTIG